MGSALVLITYYPHHLHRRMAHVTLVRNGSDFYPMFWSRIAKPEKSIIFRINPNPIDNLTIPHYHAIYKLYFTTSLSLI